MAYHDNLAYQYEYAPAYDPLAPSPRRRATARPKPQTKSAAKPKAAAKPRLRFTTVLMALVIAVGAFFILYRAVTITAMTNEITKKEKQLSDLQAANQQTSLEIDRSLDLKKIEETATQRLGMRRPEKFQMVYVDLEKVDYVEHTAKSEGNLFTKIGGFFRSIAHYFD